MSGSASRPKESICRLHGLGNLLLVGICAWSVMGCGGGGGGSTPPVQTTYGPQTVVLAKSDGRQIQSFTDSTVVVSGDTSAIHTGSIIASSQGNGLLRKVTGIVSSGSINNVFDNTSIDRGCDSDGKHHRSAHIRGSFHRFLHTWWPRYHDAKWRQRGSSAGIRRGFNYPQFDRVSTCGWKRRQVWNDYAEWFAHPICQMSRHRCKSDSSRSRTSAAMRP